MILAGDVGGTKILLEVGDARSGRWQPAFARQVASAEVTNFPAVVERFLAEWEEVKPARARITGAGFGVAGPVQGNKAKMTNRPWAVDGDTLARRFGIDHVRVVNDLAAAAHGLALLEPKELVTLQPGKALDDAPRVVLGVGTGLGVAYLVPGAPTPRSGASRFVVVPGEGGHMSFAPTTPEQRFLWEHLFLARGRVEAEDVCSGNGIANIYEFLRGRAAGAAMAGEQRADPAWVSRNAFAKSDATCEEALALFVECLGNIAGDHALAVMARGGVYLAGGVVAKIVPLLKGARFRAAFCAKGAFTNHAQRMPVRAVTTERLTVLGAARVGQPE